MESYIYTAMSGALRSLNAQRIHANNLANVGTSGFRADFERAEAYQIEGPGFASRHLSSPQAAGSDFSTGRLETTGRNLDIGIRGPGFIAVQTQGGQEAYTRAGHMELDAQGQLRINGNPVLGEDGPLEIPEYRDISIGEDGTISVLPPDGNAILEVGQIKRVNPAATELRKGSDGLFRLIDGVAAPLDDEVLVLAGHLEGANVSAVDEMVSTMALSRSFEMQVKMMKTADELSAAGSRLVRGS